MKHYWREGEGVLFDDTFLHDAKNESDEVRVVLYLELLRRMPTPLDAASRFDLSVDPGGRRNSQECSLGHGVIRVPGTRSCHPSSLVGAESNRT